MGLMKSKRGNQESEILTGMHFGGLAVGSVAEKRDSDPGRPPSLLGGYDQFT